VLAPAAPLRVPLLLRATPPSVSAPMPPPDPTVQLLPVTEGDFAALARLDLIGQEMAKSIREIERTMAIAMSMTMMA